MVWDRRIRHRLGWPAGGTFRISVNKVKIAMLLARTFFFATPFFRLSLCFWIRGEGPEVRPGRAPSSLQPAIAPL